MKNSEIKSIDDLPEYMPEKLAAEFLHKSPKTLWEYRRKGLISFRRSGGIFYTRDDIREFLERVKCSAAAA